MFDDVLGGRRTYGDEPSSCVAFGTRPSLLHRSDLAHLGRPFVVHEPAPDRTHRPNDDSQPLDSGVELETSGINKKDCQI